MIRGVDVVAERFAPRCRRARTRVPVWVRSLVPKEKNSACSATSPATKHARGSSIIVPMLKSRPSATPSSTPHAHHAVARELELARVGDERDHDLDHRRAARALVHGARGAEDRPRLHLVDLRVNEAQPDPAGAEHRVALLERAHALERVLELAQLGRCRAAAPP